MEGGAREDLYWHTSLMLKYVSVDNARIVRLAKMVTDKEDAGV